MNPFSVLGLDYPSAVHSSGLTRLQMSDINRKKFHSLCIQFHGLFSEFSKMHARFKQIKSFTDLLSNSDKEIILRQQQLIEFLKRFANQFLLFRLEHIIVEPV